MAARVKGTVLANAGAAGHGQQVIATHQVCERQPHNVRTGVERSCQVLAADAVPFGGQS